jgi:hypothetical protein
LGNSEATLNLKDFSLFAYNGFTSRMNIVSLDGLNSAEAAKTSPIWLYAWATWPINISVQQ